MVTATFQVTVQFGLGFMRFLEGILNFVGQFVVGLFFYSDRLIVLLIVRFWQAILNFGCN